LGDDRQQYRVPCPGEGVGKMEACLMRLLILFFSPSEADFRQSAKKSSVKSFREKVLDAVFDEKLP
jgi:hypothetical protein